jgi:anti-sigma factor (TIGR02949 family)
MEINNKPNENSITTNKQTSSYESQIAITANRFGVNSPGSPYTPEECEEIISKLEALLDGELDPQKQKEVEDMIRSCEFCLEQYNIEKSIRKIVKLGLKNLFISKNLVANIKNQIKNIKKSSSQ